MQSQQATVERQPRAEASPKDSAFAPALPALSLPKGGGAIHGIGEKFATNPATGTGAMTIPVPVSQGRSGFAPQLTLTYDSGSGNGPFGLGWSLSLPSITRKTDKGLPQYDDAGGSDVFLLSGAEDLVPEFRRDASGGFASGAGGAYEPWEDRRDIGGVGYRVCRYRPRTEGLFSRIERWTRIADGDTHWRSITKDNVTSLYGKRESGPAESPVNSRIADPSAPDRVFAWLLTASYDDKGNAIAYSYAAEDARGVDAEAAHEANRRASDRITNRYPKRVLYGNVRSLAAAGLPLPPLGPDLSAMEWHFEVVFDYGEKHVAAATATNAKGDLVTASLAPVEPWPVRRDAFSKYRSTFEVRTYRRCEKIAVFHHFPEELPVADCLVRSLDLGYSETGITSYLTSATSSGYAIQPDGTYLRKSLPPLEFHYARSPLEAMPTEDFPILDLPPESLENLPAGTSDGNYQWADIEGEGIAGLLCEQEGAWYFKTNLGDARLGPLGVMPTQPSIAALATGRQQLLDLAGDGQLDLVDFNRPLTGFYERSSTETWEPLRSFRRLPNLDWGAADVRFTDLTGDGLADILITSGGELTWHESLGENGFDAGITLRLPADEQAGPRVLATDSVQAIVLADMSGDGLSDLVRITASEVSYWPNLGYGRFGRRISMGNSPRLDSPDQFDPRRIHLADTDGSGVADIIYHGRRGVAIALNQAGNSWSDVRLLESVPPAHHQSSLSTVDLLGTGTTCLVWSSSLPGDARRSMKYLDLMKGQKPHLLVRTENNLGAETAIEYASSTRFYLQDKANGTPWITRLPFPVHVVSRVVTFDRISRNRFASTYTYHHGHFDGLEREFRGFGRVDQTDTEDFGTLTADDTLPAGDNVSASSHVAPVLTRSWFHTGVYAEGERVSKHHEAEYYRPPLPPAQAAWPLLADTLLPAGLTAEEEREACRALRGQMLRQEVYALDGSGEPDRPFGHPYVVTEQNFTVEAIQPRSGNRYGVFFTRPRESIVFQVERDPKDPRVAHTMTLEVDDFGNVLKSAAISYGRQVDEPGFLSEDFRIQKTSRILYTENRFTNPISTADVLRTPVSSEVLTYELTGFGNGPFQLDSFVRRSESGLESASEGEVPYEGPLDTSKKQRRLVEHVRTIYRRDDFSGPLPLGTVESLAIPFESYKLAFTPGLLSRLFDGKATTAMLESEGQYRHSEGDSNWWVPSGRMFYSPTRGHSDAEELHHARNHFFLPCRSRDPFHTSAIGTEAVIRHDAYDLLVLETEDALGNRVTAGTRDTGPQPAVTATALDYRTLQPAMVMDPNRNRSFVAFDALGMVVGTAVSGKPGEMSAVNPALELGDSLDGFEPDLPLSRITAHLANPIGNPRDILAKASTRLVYDLAAYYRTKHTASPSAPFVSTLVRETHESELPAGEAPRVQHSFSYSDGFGREIQKKVQAEPGPVPKRSPTTGRILVGANGQPVMNAVEANPRWVGTGWKVFNNKGKPVRQFEPFFTDTHRFEVDSGIGVSSVLFYDPPGRVVATLHPNHTYEKVVFNPWRQETWDVNDTVLSTPQSDDHVKGVTAGYFASLPSGPVATPWPSWHEQRRGGALGPAEQAAADKAAKHAGTPTTAHFDPLGRAFLTIADNGPNPADATKHLLYATRVEIDIEGNEREIRDAVVGAGDPRGRVVMQYDYDMLGNRGYSTSMEAGKRWILQDVAGQPIYTWNSRDHRLHTIYDRLHRAIEVRLKSGTSAEIVVEQTYYGDNGTATDPEKANLRTRVARHNDQAGVVVSDGYDFKGNLLQSTRLLAKDYRHSLDWRSPVDLDSSSSWATSRSFDALNRPVAMTTPDGSTVRPRYNEAGLLEAIVAHLAGDAPGAETPFVLNIDYNAKGQRTRIDYANGATTTHTYDPLTFRLARLVTNRDARGNPDDSRSPPPSGWPGSGLQDLTYTYDPAGNITGIRDDAQQSIFFNNKRVDPLAEYTYDAIYRLIEATGREALTGSAPVRPGSYGFEHAGRAHPGDGNAMGTYRQSYLYDAVGNFLAMQHQGSDPANSGWTLSYAYEAASLIDGRTEKSNQLTATSSGGARGSYTYDAHGNMTSMPHLSKMEWDHRDQLVSTTRSLNNASEDTFYVYDSQGERVRKVSVGPGGVKRHERIYLDGFEVYRKYDGAGETTLKRETLHVMDDKQRIAMVERRTQGSDGPDRLIRYQLGNHLGTACIELDDAAKVISYEEYFPYGATSYQAVKNGLEANPKRYRYTGKERDEENGLYYHGARYYAPWLGRWTACDPAELTDGMNRYSYVNNRPAVLSDPTGRWGEAGHYYTMYFLSLAAGFDSNTAMSNAYYTQMPDEAHELDAISTQTNRVTKFWSLQEQCHRDIIQKGLHSLTGGESAKATVDTLQAIATAKPGTAAFGFLAHRLGDTYAHRQLDAPDTLYSVGLGHAADQHRPDQIHNRIQEYRQYTRDLGNVLRGAASRHGTTSKLSSDAVEHVLSDVISQRVLTWYSMKGWLEVVDDEATERSQIAAFRQWAAFLGEPMAGYRPELSDKMALSDLLRSAPPPPDSNGVRPRAQEILNTVEDVAGMVGETSQCRGAVIRISPQ